MKHNHTDKVFERGDRILDTKHNKTGTILGPEDFEGYEYNRPSNDSELINWDGISDGNAFKISWYWHEYMVKGNSNEA